MLSVSSLPFKPRLLPPLEPGFIPAALWNRAFLALVAQDASARPLSLALSRSDGTVSRYDTRVLGAGHAAADLNLRYLERLLKFLLWQQSGCHVQIAGGDEVTGQLAKIYSATGARVF